jgi:hypothetical protein
MEKMHAIFRDYVLDVFLWALQQFKDLRSMHASYQFVNAFPRHVAIVVCLTKVDVTIINSS